MMKNAKLTKSLLILAVVYATVGLLTFEGCKKQPEPLYPSISFEYDQSLLGSIIELPEAGISFQPIEGWDDLSAEQFSRMKEGFMSNSSLLLVSAHKPAEQDFICLVSIFPNSNEADTLMVHQYLEAQIAHSDTLYSRGRFTHNEIQFDQVIARIGEHTAIHLIGNPQGKPERFAVSYLITNQDYTDNVKRMEASIASIKPLRR